jgi:hypothetical protein
VSYAVLFLADGWEWDGVVATGDFQAAKDAARGALEELVKAEAPKIACVTLIEDGRKIGVWDWIAGQAHWSSL